MNVSRLRSSLGESRARLTAIEIGPPRPVRLFAVYVNSLRLDYSAKQVFVILGIVIAACRIGAPRHYFPRQSPWLARISEIPCSPCKTVSDYSRCAAY